MTTWPSTLVIRRDAFNETPPARQLRSSMDVGPDKVRRRTTLAPRNITIQMLLTDALLDTFDDFYVANDTGIFDFVHPRTTETMTARFTDEPPTYESMDNLWNVKVTLELLP